jgi:dTDP-4-amino-4,6-dideoxygalactose transaminase
MNHNNSSSSSSPLTANRSPIPYGKHEITMEDIKAVEEVLRSDFLTQGPKVQEFEEAFADYVGSDYAVAVANGTAALHLSAMALDVKPGQKVITTPITFAASANCVRYCGGEVIFCDIDPETYLLDINKVRETLEERKDEDIVGIIPADFAGLPVDMEAFRKLADEYGLWVLEDSCHAPGAYFTDSKGQKQHCGNGNFADLAIFSFHPVKHIAAGEGGMITTNNNELYDRIKTLRTHGITKDQEKFQNSVEMAMGEQSVVNSKRSAVSSKQSTAHSSQLTAHKSAAHGSQLTYPGWYYEMQELGYNYRMTDMQAALGLSQLQRADENLNRRQQIAQKYDEAFRDISEIQTQSLTLKGERSTVSSEQSAAHDSPLTAHRSRVTAHENHGSPLTGHAYHLYVIQTPNRKELFDHLRANNILVQVHYIPLHYLPYYRDMGFQVGDFPNAENYYQGCISIPMYHGMSEEQQEFVIDQIHKWTQMNAQMATK